MRVLSETASTLSIGYPVWLGLACLVVTYALSIWFIKGARKSKRPMQQFTAGIGGIVIGSFVGFSALVDRTTMDSSGARDRRLLAGAQSADWKDVVEVKVEHRNVGKRGEQPHIVLRRTPYGEMAVEISGLTPGEIERVVAFARARAVKRS